MFSPLQNLLRVDLSNVLRIPDIFWSVIIPSLNNLRVINLRSTNCGDQEVLTIVKYCHHLRYWVFFHVSIPSRIVNF